MKFSNLLMCVATVLMLAVMLFGAPSMSHAGLPPGGGDATLMGLSDTISTPSATILADNTMVLADEALITTLAVAARTREHTFNLMDEHNMITVARCAATCFASKPKGDGHSPPQQRKILLT